MDSKVLEYHELLKKIESSKDPSHLRALEHKIVHDGIPYHV